MDRPRSRVARPRVSPLPLAALLVVALPGLPRAADGDAPPSSLPDTVRVRVGARLHIDRVRATLPDGSVHLLGPAGEERLMLPPGTSVELADGEVRRYAGLLTVRRVDDEVIAVLDVDTEDYVAGVVQAEMGADAPDAALRAQAIASRSLIAVAVDRHPEGDWDLCDLTHCQSFRGEATSEAARAAARDTAGQVLTVHGRPVEAPFHSTCGGHTLSAEQVWGHAAAHLPGVEDRRPDGTPWCSTSPHGSWRAAVDGEGLPDARLDHERFRLAVGRLHGWNVVRSNHYDVTALQHRGRTIWLLQGVGLGHAVGLCQQGAIARARAGQTTAQILSAYFPGAVAAPLEGPR